jgi:site-specific recombinase XerC
MGFVRTLPLEKHLSEQAAAKIIAMYGHDRWRAIYDRRRAGAINPEAARTEHPHALRAYWATHCLEAGVPVHTVSARLGHVDLRTTARYAAARPEQIDDIADVLDRRHQFARRAGEAT